MAQCAVWRAENVLCLPVERLSSLAEHRVVGWEGIEGVWGIKEMYQSEERFLIEAGYPLQVILCLEVQERTGLKTEFIARDYANVAYFLEYRPGNDCKCYNSKRPISELNLSK
jgi:hypothetical protein